MENRYTDYSRLLCYKKNGVEKYLPVLKPTVTEEGDSLKIEFKSPIKEVEFTEESRIILLEEATKLYPEYPEDKIIIVYKI